MLAYLPYLKKAGIDADVEPLLDDEYLHHLYSGGRTRRSSVLSGFAERWRVLRRAKRYDLVWLQYEAFPWLPLVAETWLGAFSIPFVVDYDDAWFHRYDQHPNQIVRRLLGGKIDEVMRRASAVIAGNEYLAMRARESGSKHVEIIPTVVDLSRYSQDSHSTKSTIGWIGSPATQHFVDQVAPIIMRVLDEEPHVEFHAVGANRQMIDHTNAHSFPWSEESEAKQVASFSVGIMPLTDGPFERGKCGYKLIQCMACGVPVVASPVGVNRNIVNHGVDGYLADTPAEWYRALKALISDASRRAEMGFAAREKVRSEYCLEVTAPRIRRVLSSAVLESASTT